NLFITELNGLTGLNLNAGAGSITLLVMFGAVTDADPDADITGGLAFIRVLEGGVKNFGADASHPINTSVNDLTVLTFGGNEFITESNGLTALSLGAGAGTITLIVTTGAVTDADDFDDIAASTATVTLNDPGPRDFGGATPIDTSVDDLS